MIAPRQSPGQPAVHRSPVTLQDLLDDLLWPHLLRSWKLALAPGRVALCFLLVCFAGVVVFTYQGITGTHVFRDLVANVKQCVSFRPDGTGLTDYFEAGALSAYRLFVGIPWELFRQHSVVGLVLMPLILLAWCAVGAALCRSCACEVSLRAALPWRKAVAFGVRKTTAGFAAIAGPLVLLWCACLLLKLYGLVFFTSNIMGILGAILFVFPLILCLVMAGSAIAYLLAHSLLIPAVACEGTDSFDAVQRCYAYVLARPGRLVGYMLIALGTLLPAVLVVGVIGVFAIKLAYTMTGSPLPMVDAEWQVQGAEGYAFSRWVTHWWVRLLLALVAAYFISLYFCAATNLYLIMRRLVDGQDITELWTPPVPVSATIEQTQPGIQAQPTIPPIPDKADYT